MPRHPASQADKTSSTSIALTGGFADGIGDGSRDGPTRCSVWQIHSWTAPMSSRAAPKRSSPSCQIAAFACPAFSANSAADNR